MIALKEASKTHEARAGGTARASTNPLGGERLGNTANGGDIQARNALHTLPLAWVMNDDHLERVRVMFGLRTAGEALAFVAPARRALILGKAVRHA